MNDQILTATKLETLSKNYVEVQSQTIVDELVNRGFTLDNIVKCKTRKIERQGKQLHRLIFTNPNLLAQDNKGKMQLIVSNSYDGTSAIHFTLGYFRLVCSNGLMVGNTYEQVSIRHIGQNNISEKIEKAIETIVAQSKKLHEQFEKMRGLVLDQNAVKAIEMAGVRLRVPDAVDVKITVLRNEDQANTLFNVYNRVQETLIRGGSKVTVFDSEKNKEVIKTVRAIRSPKSDAILNKQIFDIAASFLVAA